MTSQYLYRGVSVTEDKRNSGKLFPTGERVSIEGQCGDPWMQCGEGIQCGSSEGNAVIAHQWESSLAKTAYVSTTKKYEIAVKFATTNNIEEGYIYTLDATKFEQYGVVVYEREIGSNHEYEVTIRSKDFGPIPEAVIVKKHMVFPA